MEVNTDPLQDGEKEKFQEITRFFISFHNGLFMKLLFNPLTKKKKTKHLGMSYLWLQEEQRPFAFQLHYNIWLNKNAWHVFNIGKYMAGFLSPL